MQTRDWLMRYKAVIFDLDGTLLNTLDDLALSVNQFLRQEGLPQRTTKEIRSYLGNGARELVRLALPGPVPDEELDSAVSRYKRIYEKNMSLSTKPYDGIMPLLRKLKEAGVKTAIVSNKPDPAVRALAEEMFEGLVTTAVGDRPGAPRKPDPKTVEQILHMLGTEEKDALYVGDSEVDVRTARNAGMDGAAVAWGYRDRDQLEEEKPDYLVETPEQLAAVIGI